MHVLLENIGHEVENIDFIYFAISHCDILKPDIGESKGFYGLSTEDVKNGNEIKSHIKQIALDALNKLCK